MMPGSERSATLARAIPRCRRFAPREYLAFSTFPPTRRCTKQSTDFAVTCTKGKFDDVVLLGIGGSALGSLALHSALGKPDWNALASMGRGGWPRFHILDNVDPGTIAALFPRLDLARTLFVVISKSGGTAETMAQYLVIRGRLNAALGQGARDHLIFVTDPEKGALRAQARQEGFAAVDILAVSGRAVQAQAHPSLGCSQRHCWEWIRRRCSPAQPTWQRDAKRRRCARILEPPLACCNGWPTRRWGGGSTC